MKKEKSCGTIVFLRNPTRYLILYKKAHEKYRELWDFPRGNIDEKENEKETARRELKEETGIEKINFIDGFYETIRFFYRNNNELVGKEIVFFLAEIENEKVNLSYEHDDCKWLSFQDALKVLSHKNSREILEKADKFLKEKFRQKTLF